ncbi:hypothetical protein D3C71_1890350 [compost metagenome]
MLIWFCAQVQALSFCLGLDLLQAHQLAIPGEAVGQFLGDVGALGEDAQARDDVVMVGAPVLGLVAGGRQLCMLALQLIRAGCGQGVQVAGARQLRTLAKMHGDAQRLGLYRWRWLRAVTGLGILCHG